MRYRRSPTGPQKLMLAFLAAALLALAGFGVVEFTGVFDPGPEDTFSEWAFDLPLWGTVLVSLLSVVIGTLAIGSAWHYLEGWVRRRREERHGRQ